MKNILKRLSIFAVLIAIVSNVCVASTIAAVHEHKEAFSLMVTYYREQDENYHRYCTAWDSRCDCGQKLGIIDETYVLESHSWDGDICSQCGYERKHTHTGVSKGNKVTTLKSYDENTHTYSIAYESLCSCGELVGLIDETTTTTNHNFKDDKCSDCGYTKKHTHKGVTKGDKVTTLKSYDETTHTYVIAYENLCSCGEAMGLIDETTSTSNHSFKNDKCTECGYITKTPAKDETGILGDFFEDANVDGVVARIIIGKIPDAGLVVEVSGLLTNKNIVGANPLEHVPLIGTLKYKDDVYAVVKNADGLENIIENADEFYQIERPIIRREASKVT